MALPIALRAFRHSDFRRFFTAQLVAQIGSWMQTVAQSWLVLTLTSSPLLLGLIGTLQFSPILLFSIVSGALADRARLREELHHVDADVFLVELKAAAVDVVVEEAARRGIRVVIAANDVVALGGEPDLDAELERLAVEASALVPEAVQL